MIWSSDSASSVQAIRIASIDVAMAIALTNALRHPMFRLNSGLSRKAWGRSALHDSLKAEPIVALITKHDRTA
jgi:hypothetical protein